MRERVFDIAELPAEVDGCDCLPCRAAPAFARHLELTRPAEWGFTEVQVPGHARPRPDESVVVSHFMLLRNSERLKDQVVLEVMPCPMLALWSPVPDPPLAAAQRALEDLRKIRVDLRRRGPGFLPGRPRRALLNGRYPSFRFFLEFWTDLTEAGLC